MYNIVIFCILLLILSYAATYIVRAFALKHKIIDIPNKRSSHTVPTPRGGGIAIVLCWYIGITYMLLINHLDKKLYFSLLSGVLLAIVSLRDDMFSLRPKVRLLVQFVTTLLALGFLGIFKGLVFFEIRFIIVLLYIFGVIWFINIFNFLDGIDGYASLEALFICSSLFIFIQNPIFLMLGFPTLGFLIWNWPKAKIFMGDIGSTQLGFIISIFGIYFNQTSEIHMIEWIMLTSLFWVDATLTLFRRWRNKEKLTVAHKKHAYQRAVQAGFSHKKTILFAALANLIIFFLVYVARTNQNLINFMFILNLTFVYFLIRIVDKKVPFEKRIIHTI